MKSNKKYIVVTSKNRSDKYTTVHLNNDGTPKCNTSAKHMLFKNEVKETLKRCKICFKKTAPQRRIKAIEPVVNIGGCEVKNKPLSPSLVKWAKPTQISFGAGKRYPALEFENNFWIFSSPQQLKSQLKAFNML